MNEPFFVGWSTTLGIGWFVVVCVLVEVYVVRRRILSDRSLKAIDFVWVCTSAVTLTFLLLNARDTLLKDEVAALENSSLLERQVQYGKIQAGSAACEAGT